MYILLQAITVCEFPVSGLFAACVQFCMSSADSSSHLDKAALPGRFSSADAVIIRYKPEALQIITGIALSVKMHGELLALFKLIKLFLSLPEKNVQGSTQ